VQHEAAADDGLSVLSLDVLAALRAYDPDADAMAAGLVQQINGRCGEVCPLVAPLQERGVGPAYEDAVVDQPVEAVDDTSSGSAS
jgi:hypothetical protein